MIQDVIMEKRSGIVF